MKAEIKIHFTWTCDLNIEVPNEHREALHENATERIFEQVKEGYTNGELITSVRLGKDIVPIEDEQNGLSYSGWWSLNTKIIN